MDEHTLRKKLKGIGSRHWTAEDAREVLAAQAASGASIDVFARRIGVRATRLVWWKTQLQEWVGGGSGATAAFVPAVVREPAAVTVGSACALTVRLPTGELVEIEDTSAVEADWVASFVVGCARRG